MCLLLCGCAAKASTATSPDSEAEVREWREIDAYIRVHGLCRGDGGAPEAGRGKPSKLPPEVIQYIVRGNYEEFRECYEEGVRHNPALRGRVLMRFIIDPDGRVSKADEIGGAMPDREVVRCIVERYTQLCFPPPEGGGIITVTYPIVFAPRD
jgi:hypothetical protein